MTKTAIRHALGTQIASYGRRLRLPRDERATRRHHHMAPGHPEWLTRESPEGDDEILGALCAELWPDDEYTEITAEGGGTR